jgi:uracil-DNA glycosylase
VNPRPAELVRRLAATKIGETFNQYAASHRLRRRLRHYLEAHEGMPVLLVGEAAGYRGARVSGIPFTSERQLTGAGPAEATATIVHGVLADLGLDRRVLLWNVVPTHPHRAAEPASNRRPTRAEIEAGLVFVDVLAHGRSVVAVGRIAAAALGASAPYVRHPSHGGAREFRSGLVELLRP